MFYFTGIHESVACVHVLVRKIPEHRFQIPNRSINMIKILDFDVWVIGYLYEGK
jgi:hypothetical protein